MPLALGPLLKRLSPGLLLCVLALPAVAHAAVRPPVLVTIASETPLSVGQPARIVVTLRGGGLANVSLTLVVPPAWQATSGELTWKGSLPASQPVTFSIEAVPLVPDPEPIRGVLAVPGWNATTWTMDMQRVPVHGFVGGSAVHHSPAGREIVPALGATVTATGRFVYRDDGGNLVGVPNATVRMWDYDFFFPCGPTLGMCRELMATGQTDANGYYTLVGSGGDPLADLPDPYMEIEADSSAVVVQTAGILNSNYCFKTPGYANNAADGSLIDFGTIEPHATGGCATESDVTSEHGAWQLFTNATESRDFVQPFSLVDPGSSGGDTGGYIPKVRVFWPDTGSYYRPPIIFVDDGGISIAGGDTWNESVIVHEYGHHVMTHFAESPAPDYDNGVCDIPDPGHCVWRWELGSVHWTEGWPDFLSRVITTVLAKNSPFVDLETPPHPHPDENFRFIEGYTAAILWDIFDNPMDNHDGNNSRDQLVLGFYSQWDVLVNFDPAPLDGSHNHPVTIDEFWGGWLERYASIVNQVSEVYHEQHMTDKAAAELSVSNVYASATWVAAGMPITIDDRVSNWGTVSSGVGSTARFVISTDFFITPSDPLLGERAVPVLGPLGAYSSAATSVTVPISLAPGTYYLGACADPAQVVFESNEDNCALGPLIEVGAAPDLVVLDIVTTPASPQPGQNVTVTVNVRNDGGTTWEPFQIDFYKHLSSAPAPGQPGDYRCTKTRGLRSGVTGTCIFTASYPAAGTYSMWAQVDTEGQVPESSEANNRLGPQPLVVLAGDNVPPTGTIKIKNGAVWTNKTTVTLNLTCTDPAPGTGCTQMQFSGDNVTFTPLESFALTKKWVLPAGDGLKTVYVRYRDGAGNVSASLFDTITLDQTRPSLASIGHAPEPFNPDLTLLTFSFVVADNLSPTCTVSVKIYNSANVLVKSLSKSVTCTPAGSPGAMTWNGKDKARVRVPAGSYTYTVTVKDKAANLSPAIVRSLTIL